MEAERKTTVVKRENEMLEHRRHYSDSKKQIEAVRIRSTLQKKS